MNDDTKIVNQNAPRVAQTDQPQAQVQPVAPVGSAKKEVGLVGSNVSEFAKPSEVEPQIDKDLEELGIEAKKDAPNLTDEHRGVIEHAKQFTPIPNPPSGKVTMPMSEKEIENRLKTGQDDDSGRWLIGLIQKVKKVIRAMGF